MPNAQTLQILYPSLFVSGGLAALVVLGSFVKKGAFVLLPAARALACAAIAAGFLFALRNAGARWEGDLVRWDGASALWLLLFFAGAAPLVFLMDAQDEVPLILVLGAAAGMTLLGVARHLFLLFLGLEILSLSVYLLVARLGPGRLGLEAAVKYFFSGAFAAALYLFGLAVYYAKTGHMMMTPHLEKSPILQLGLTLMACAGLFKVGVFPFHFWLPDAYEAASPELAGFMSTAVKAAGFLLLLRMLPLMPLWGAPGPVQWLPWASAATMTFGNLLALRQERLQRLLAYSSISHVGYLLAGLWAWMRLGSNPAGASALYLYLAVYLFMNTGAFLFLGLTGIKDYAHLKGFARRSPGLAAFFAIMVLSLAAVPPTGGFLIKFFVFWDILRAGGVWLAAAAALNSLVGLGYYFKLIRSLVLEEPASATAPVPAPLGLPARLVLWACCAGTVISGLVPGARIVIASWLG